MYEEIQRLKEKRFELLRESRGNLAVPSQSANEGGSQRIPT